MVLLVLLVRQHAEHDHQKCPHTIEQQHVESIELNKDDHAHDEDQQTNGRAGLNTGPVSAADPNHAPETNAQRQEHIVDHDQPKNPHVGLMLRPKLTEQAREIKQGEQGQRKGDHHLKDQQDRESSLPCAFSLTVVVLGCAEEARVTGSDRTLLARPAAREYGEPRAAAFANGAIRFANGAAVEVQRT